MNFQESTTILNARTKKSGNLLNEQRISALNDPYGFKLMNQTKLLWLQG